MEKNIYEGSYKLVSILESALLVDQYKMPGITAEGVDVMVKHLSGVTIKQERYEDMGRTINPLASLTIEDLKYTGLMKITLYADNETHLGEVERIILEEIERK